MGLQIVANDATNTRGFSPAPALSYPFLFKKYNAVQALINRSQVKRSRIRDFNLAWPKFS